MCDYSLEMYQSRPARVGEEYTSNRFPSGTVGFVVAGDQSVAICMECDWKLQLANISPAVRATADVSENEVATFTQIDGPWHRDSVRFANGAVVSLQKLGPGVRAWLIPDRHVAPTTSQQVREVEFA